MKKVFIIHGFQGSPNGGWRPWLMRELEKLDIYACALPMPTPDAPVKEEWIEEIRQYIKNPSDEYYLIGHSLGVPAILHCLQENNIKIAGVVLASGPFEASRKEIASFYDKSFDFEKIRSVCKTFAIVHGDNDPNVPLDHAKRFSEVLNAELSIVKNGGHLNGSSGCVELPEVLEALIKIMK